MNVDVESRPSSPVDGDSTAKDEDSEDVKSLRAEEVVKRPAHFKGESFFLPFVLQYVFFRREYETDETPNADFVRHFSQWENAKLLFATSASWFLLDIACVSSLHSPSFLPSLLLALCLLFPPLPRLSHPPLALAPPSYLKAR